MVTTQFGFNLGVVGHTCNLSIQETEAGEFQVWVSLAYNSEYIYNKIVSQKKKKKKGKNPENSTKIASASW
jgi:hypothetical protein